MGINIHSIKKSFLLLSLLLTHIQSKLIKDQVTIAINCGGPEYIDDDGIVYEKVFNLNYITIGQLL